MKKLDAALGVHHKDITARVLTGVIVSIAVLLLYMYQPAFMQWAERQSYDLLLRLSDKGEIPLEPAIIDVDDPSLEALGQWPWPRHMTARMLQTLADHGAAAIAVDFLLTKPDRTSPVNLQKYLKHDFGIDMHFQGLPEILYDNDIFMAETLRHVPAVLAMRVNFDILPGLASHVEMPRTPFPITIREVKKASAPDIRQHLLDGREAILPLPMYMASAPLGSLTVPTDVDGVARAIPVVCKVGDTIQPTLALRAIMRAQNIDELELVGSSRGLSEVRAGAYHISVTPQGMLRVPFRGGKGVYPYYSAVDLLEDRIPTDKIKGRIFFIGSSAGKLGDIRANPYDAHFPKVEIHAAIADAILTDGSIERPSWAKALQIAEIIAAGVVATLAFSLASASVYLPLFALMLVSIYVVCTYFFQHGMFLSPAYAVLQTLLFLVCILGVRFWQEYQQRRLLRRAFTRYVTPEMVDRITDRGDAVLSGEEREVTMLFTDIRGFTSISEQLSPQNVVDLLNRYFTPMTAIITAHNGTVDKFIGDAIMAFWNAPLDVPNHPLQAVRAGMEMQHALVEVNKALRKDMDTTIRMGIGVHTGNVFVGNMGTRELMDYTCVGDTVNLTSRIEDQCPVYGESFLVSADAATRCERITENAQETPDSIKFLRIDAIQVKGKTKPVEICLPMPLREYKTRQEELSCFEAARRLYINGDFTKAACLFARLQEQYTSSILYALFLNRTRALERTPPPQWDGVWNYTDNIELSQISPVKWW